MSDPTTNTLLLLFVIGLLLGRYWPRRPPRTSYTSLDAAIDAVSRVVAGLHEDLDSVRGELRAAVQLPPESQIPRVLAKLRQIRLMTYVLIALHIVLGIAVALLFFELRRRGVLALQ